MRFLLCWGLTACAFPHGEMAAVRGVSPTLGDFNPRLAGCHVTVDGSEHRYYDKHGLLEKVGTLGNTDGFSYVYDGACRSSIRRRGGGPDEGDADFVAKCDSHGWPTEITITTSGAGSRIYEEWTNEYEGGLLSRRSGVGEWGLVHMTTSFEWEDGVIASRTDTSNETALPKANYTWRSDGQIDRIDGDFGPLTVWEYEGDRPVRAVYAGLDDFRDEWEYDGGPWPVKGTFYRPTSTTVEQYVYECP